MIPINWLAVIVAVVIRMVVGGLWYSPLLFVKPWQALTGVTPESMRSGLGKAVALDIVMSLLMAVTLAEIIGIEADHAQQMRVDMRQVDPGLMHASLEHRSFSVRCPPRIWTAASSVQPRYNAVRIDFIPWLCIQLLFIDRLA